jgi:hypothetical protein
MRPATQWSSDTAMRERLRTTAAERFALGPETALIAKDLRIHVRSVQRWRKA